jgi:hypothetical protein
LAAFGWKPERNAIADSDFVRLRLVVEQFATDAAGDLIPASIVTPSHVTVVTSLAMRRLIAGCLSSITCVDKYRWPVWRDAITLGGATEGVGLFPCAASDGI